MEKYIRWEFKFDFYWHSAPHFLIDFNEIIYTIFVIRYIVVSQKVCTQLETLFSANKYALRNTNCIAFMQMVELNFVFMKFGVFCM